MHACTAETTYQPCQILTKQKILHVPDLPSWADKIVKLCPDMNIKIADHTVTQQLNNISINFEKEVHPVHLLAGIW